MVQLILKWLEETAGGLEGIENANRKKAALLYNVIDGDQFYSGTAEPDSRSFMNITFRLPDENLEKKFVAEALQNGLGGLKAKVILRIAGDRLIGSDDYTFGDLRYFDRIGKRYALKDGNYIMVGVFPFAEDLEEQINFRGSFNSDAVHNFS